MSYVDPVAPSQLRAENGSKKVRSVPKLTPAEVTSSINPSSKKRRAILLSFPLLFLLAVPFWWYTTSIERLPLPTARIDTLSDTTIPALVTPILLTADRDAFPTPPPGKGVFETHEILASLGREVMKGVDGIYDRQRPQKKRTWTLVYEEDRSNPTPLRVHIRRFEHANTSWPLEPYVQPREKGLMTSGIHEGTSVIPVHPDQIGDRFLKQHYKIALINSILSLFPDQPPTVPLRALKYSPNITLSFVLLNEDASEGSYVRSWDIEDAIRDHIVPHLEPLNQVFNFTIESQLLYHAPLTFEPTYTSLPGSSTGKTNQIDAAIDAAAQGDEGAEIVAKELLDQQVEKGWLIDEEMMKVFVNSEKWSLDSGSTNNPVLRFLLYIPKEAHRPTRLASGDSAQSFLLPQFGGVVILNPPSSLPSSDAYHLPLPSLAPSFHLFTQHLYSLLALPTLLDKGKIHPPPAPSPLHRPSPFWQPITPWQIYQVLLQRGKENAEEAAKTLVGIKRLVAKIREMKVGEGVRGKVNGAVERLERLSSDHSALTNFVLARDAVNLANKAFFDPSMMGLLYFPDEHKFAVYTPLFAPIAVPLILGLLKELVAWRKRRAAKKQVNPTPLVEAEVDEVGVAEPRNGTQGENIGVQDVQPGVVAQAQAQESGVGNGISEPELASDQRTLRSRFGR